MAESELAIPVMKWLESRGLTPYGEIRWYDRAIDVVGLSEELIVAVELKPSLTRKVKYQAHLNQLACNFSWCAVATRPRKLPEGPFGQIGVLSVICGSVEVVREAGPSTAAIEHHMRSIRGVCHYKQPWGEAGVPTMRGIGPAQDVCNAVESYVEDHPHATWQEIFDAVPNHYKHARSMQGAMRIVRKVRARRALRMAKKLAESN